MHQAEVGVNSSGAALILSARSQPHRAARHPDDGVLTTVEEHPVTETQHAGGGSHSCPHHRGLGQRHGQLDVQVVAPQQVKQHR
jgi:hypothetical protein